MPEEEVRLAVRAALLHDFFRLQPLQPIAFSRAKVSISRCGGSTAGTFWTIGRIAANRAMRVFGLTQEQYDAIARHMFPLTAMPRTKMAWLITLADKQVAAGEMLTATESGPMPSICGGAPAGRRPESKQKAAERFRQ